MIISRQIAKPNVQAMIKALRGAGLTVAKLKNGYECFNDQGVLLFKAMNGNHDYLVRMQDNLFV